jgi:hypothetical protein
MKLAVDAGESIHGRVAGGCGSGSAGDPCAGAVVESGARAPGAVAGAGGSFSGPLTPHADNEALLTTAIATSAMAQ